MGFDLLVALGLGGFGYFKTRRFVREKLRFVEAVKKPAVPVVAGVGTAVLAGIIIALPFVPGGWVIPVLAGLGIGAGVSHGAKDSKRLPPA